MHALAAGARLQFSLIHRQPDNLLMLCTIPFTVMILLSIALHAHRPDLLDNAFLAPGLIGLWGFASGAATDVMQSDRWVGTFDSNSAAPQDLLPVALGRILAVMCLGMVPLTESWLISWMAGFAPMIYHPWTFAATMLVTMFATVGTSLLLATALLLSRNGIIYQNLLSSPIHILSGIMVPIAFLPDVLHPVSGLIFLSWTADLLRDCMTSAGPSHVAPRLAVIAMLGFAAMYGGRKLLTAVQRRARLEGSLTYA